MYEATIKLFEGQMRIEQENNILKAVKEIGIDVDKEELLKALKYDREQYNKGYADGFKDGISKFAERLQARCLIFLDSKLEFVDELVKEMESEK